MDSYGIDATTAIGCGGDILQIFGNIVPALSQFSDILRAMGAGVDLATLLAEAYALRGCDSVSCLVGPCCDAYDNCPWILGPVFAIPKAGCELVDILTNGW